MRIGIKAILYNDHFRKARLDCGYKTIRALSFESNINETRLSAFERMAVSPSLSTAMRLSEILKQDVEYLFPKLSKKIAKSKRLRTQLYFTKEMVSIKKPIDPLRIIYQNDLKVNIKKALNMLDDREKKLLEFRFGIYDGERKTLEELGENFNLSKERVRMIEATALRKLRYAKSKILEETMENGVEE